MHLPSREFECRSNCTLLSAFLARTASTTPFDSPLSLTKKKKNDLAKNDGSTLYNELENTQGKHTASRQLGTTLSNEAALLRQRVRLDCLLLHLVGREGRGERAHLGKRGRDVLAAAGS